MLAVLTGALSPAQACQGGGCECEPACAPHSSWYSDTPASLAAAPCTAWHGSTVPVGKHGANAGSHRGEQPAITAGPLRSRAPGRRRQTATLPGLERHPPSFRPWLCGSWGQHPAWWPGHSWQHRSVSPALSARAASRARCSWPGCSGSLQSAFQGCSCRGPSPTAPRGAISQRWLVQRFFFVLCRVVSLALQKRRREKSWGLI